ncbi:hypothetical protein DFH07DRAFT_782203 [Mycena maculata]|uniref:Six-hairpin glycosidase n=1 Tax=Mycena maculata TaxID=230809 RepID=A0AAD7HVP9_9AGAR|nr:hypothetical protein DFH07DRAFT_782203 [Mycena maculata]
MRFKNILNVIALATSVSAASYLAGHLRDFDSYVNGSIWVQGGNIEYSEMHESGPYWFNGMVALAFQLQDQRLIGQSADGWIGPDPTDPAPGFPRLVWPRYLVLMGLEQYAEADPTQAPRILDAMHKFLSLTNSIWKNNLEGDPSLGFQYDYQYVRWEELIYSLQWLVDNDPRGQEDELIETMHLVRENGFSWKNDWFVPGIFPEEAVDYFIMQTHGVNTAEALKSEALSYRFTGDPTDKQSTIDRIDMLYEYHGRASGTFSADEHIAGLDPSRGEQIFSLAQIYQIFGNNTVADRVEKIAYNALPGGILYDWSVTNSLQAHQYDQQVNQIWAQVMDPPPWENNGPNSNVYGFEPNYPCCTVNHPMGYPKFWAHSFFAEPSANAVVHAFLGPFSFTSTLANANDVQITVDTLYPFGTTLTYTISAAKPFAFKIRVLTFAQKSTASTIAVNNAKATPLSPDAFSLHTVNVGAGKTTLHVNLNAPLEVEVRSSGAVAITRGTLNYALEIPYNDTVTLGLRLLTIQSFAGAHKPSPTLKDFSPTLPPSITPYDNHTHDNTLLPTSQWNIAIDPTTLQVLDKSATVDSIPYYAWAPGSSPVTMTATGCAIEWGLTNSTASPPPTGPNACLGEHFEVKLVPFGAAKLRLGEIPVMSVH